MYFFFCGIDETAGWGTETSHLKESAADIKRLCWIDKANKGRKQKLLIKSSLKRCFNIRFSRCPTSGLKVGREKKAKMAKLCS